MTSRKILLFKVRLLCIANAFKIFAKMSGSFVSVPKDSQDKLLKSLKDCSVYPFSIPQFKVGTLDSLMTLSDELVKSDQLAEQIVLKIVDSLKMLGTGDGTPIKDLLKVGDKSIDQYLENFSWNTMKYRSDKTLMELATTIQQELQQTDTVMKSKLQLYSQTKNSLLSQQRSTGFSS